MVFEAGFVASLKVTLKTRTNVTVIEKFFVMFSFRKIVGFGTFDEFCPVEALTSGWWNIEWKPTENGVVDA